MLCCMKHMLGGGGGSSAASTATAATTATSTSSDGESIRPEVWEKFGRRERRTNGPKKVGFRQQRWLLALERRAWQRRENAPGLAVVDGDVREEAAVETVDRYSGALNIERRLQLNQRGFRLGQLCFSAVLIYWFPTKRDHFHKTTH